MEEFKTIAYNGDIKALDEFYRRHSRRIAEILYIMLEEEKPDENIFIMNNIDFIMNMLDREEIFLRLISKHADILLRQYTTVKQLRDVFVKYPGLYNAISLRPQVLLKNRMIECDSPEELRDYCQLFKHKDYWCNYFLQIKTLTYEIFVDYE